MRPRLQQGRGTFVLWRVSMRAVLRCTARADMHLWVGGNTLGIVLAHGSCSAAVSPAVPSPVTQMPCAGTDTATLTSQHNPHTLDSSPQSLRTAYSSCLSNHTAALGPLRHTQTHTHTQCSRCSAEARAAHCHLEMLSGTCQSVSGTIRI